MTTETNTNNNNQTETQKEITAQELSDKIKQLETQSADILKVAKAKVAELQAEIQQLKQAKEALEQEKQEQTTRNTNNQQSYAASNQSLDNIAAVMVELNSVFNFK
jgi:phage shock protein A